MTNPSILAEILMSEAQVSISTSKSSPSSSLKIYPLSSTFLISFPTFSLVPCWHILTSSFNLFVFKLFLLDLRLYFPTQTMRTDPVIIRTGKCKHHLTKHPLSGKATAWPPGKEKSASSGKWEWEDISTDLEVSGKFICSIFSGPLFKHPHLRPSLSCQCLTFT